MSAPGRVLLSFRINPPPPKLGEARERQAQPRRASRPGIEDREVTGCLANSGAQTESTSSLKITLGANPRGEEAGATGNIPLRYRPTSVHWEGPSSTGEGNGNPLQYSSLENPMDGGVGWAAVHGVSKTRPRLSDFTFTFHFNALEKEMATHSSGLAWRIPRMAEPGGLPSVGSHRVGHE